MSHLDFNQLIGMKSFSRVLLRKMGWIALAWVILFFSTQWMNAGVAMLFAPMVGGMAGITIGWWMAENAVEDAGMSGLMLWLILIVAGLLPVVLVEALLNQLPGFALDFGRWMLLTGTIILTMAAAVWRASADA